MQSGIAYKGVWEKYDQLRATALELAHEQLPHIITNKYGVTSLRSQVTLSCLDYRATRSIKAWERSGSRTAEWDWPKFLNKYKIHPKRFELSIWFRDQFLSGVSVGRPTWSGNKLRIDLIEASPDKGPLDGVVTDIVILAGTIYSKVIGASQLRIMEPVNESVRNYYLSKPGFSYDQEGQLLLQGHLT